MKDIKHFKLSEFDCMETGENEMDLEFIKGLDHLRLVCNFPFRITSGFRSKNHSVEIKKPGGGGTHTQGIAADISIFDGERRHTIVRHALALGFTGVGIAKTFVHLDMRKTTPVIWVY